MSSLIAVFQIGYLGDTILSVPALASLRELVPDCSEYLLVNRVDGGGKIFPAQIFDMNWPARHRLAYSGTGGRFTRLKSVASALASLRYYRPRYAAYLMPVERTTAQISRDRLFFKAAGVKEFIGFSDLNDKELSHNSCPGVACGEAYLRFSRLWGGASQNKFAQYSVTPVLHPSPDAHRRVSEWLNLHRRWPERMLVAVAPFSNFASRSWPAAFINQFVSRLEKEAGVEAVLVGSGKDADPANQVIQSSGSGLNACGLFSIEETAALLQACHSVVAVDSGPMHLAGALGIPVIAMFSRIAPHFCRWLPLGKGHTVVYRDVDCVGCRSTECPVAGHPCMADLAPDELFAVFSAKLAGLSLPARTASGTKLLSL